MSLPSNERLNPQDVARATAMRGRFHDVVVAASKVVHEQRLNAGDKEALKWASEMLSAASSREVLLRMPSADQLTGAGNVVLALRRATQPDGGDPAEAIRALSQAVEAVLKGKRGDESRGAMESLRALFSLISRVALQTQITSQGEAGGEHQWGLSTTISHS